MGTLGLGVNVSNAHPSVCLNDTIAQTTSAAALSPFMNEEFIGRTVGYLHQWVAALAQPNVLQAILVTNSFYQFYECHWMHQ